MNPGTGKDEVLVLSYSKKSPAVDAYYAYSFYIQINPELVDNEQDLLIPGEGVQPFLIETRAPAIYCSADLKGHIKILQVTGDTLRAQLEVSRTTGGPNWQYIGEVTFKSSPLPK